MTLKLIGSTYYVWRRVPKRFASVEPRIHFKLTLKTDSEKDARSKARAVWQTALDAWEAKLSGSLQVAETQFEAARNLARSKGIVYLPAHKFDKFRPVEMISTIKANTIRSGKPEMVFAPAPLHPSAVPKITVKQALEIYWRVADDDTLGKSPDQVRRWRNPRMKAIKNFIDVCGDLALDEISADDMLNFKDWWLERIRNDGIRPNSANKDFIHLSAVLRKVNQSKRLGLNLPLDGMLFSNAVKGQREAFSEAWIRDKIVGGNHLGGLNTEARCILLGMVNTGYRPSEGASLTTSQIRLDAMIPHISIEANGRELKTVYSERLIPLAGISLEAFRECPNGFPRYYDKAGLSATINKYMRENGLMESPKHTQYGLRHSFEDRMLDRDVDERIRRDLMGHSLTRERYGKGASLEKLHGVIKSIAL